MCFINFVDHKSAVVAGEHLVKVPFLGGMKTGGTWGSVKTLSHMKWMILYHDYDVQMGNFVGPWATVGRPSFCLGQNLQIC